VTFAATIAGRALTFTGEVSGGEMMLKPEGAQNRVTLKRVK
jgi:hypothetical protein